MNWKITVLILVCRYYSVNGDAYAGCGQTKSCWLVPPNCETSDNPMNCTGILRWTIDTTGIDFEIEGSTRVLADPDNGKYVAVGFSYDQLMGADTVLECVTNATGYGKVFVSFNDGYSNSQLIQATEVIITRSTVAMINERIVCSIRWNFDGRRRVTVADQFKIANLFDGVNTFFLFMARGSADASSFKKHMHGYADGSLYPWTSASAIKFCPQCPIKTVLNMEQSSMSRNDGHRMAVAHGMMMLLGWWILGSTTMLIARYLRPFYSESRLWGTTVFIQVHRVLMLQFSVLVFLAVLLVFFESNWVYFGTCASYECSYKDLAKQLHTITGSVAVGLLVAQLLLSIVQVGGVRSERLEDFHRFNGLLTWILASASMVFAVPLSTTQLEQNYGTIPLYVMLASIASTIVITALCECMRMSHNRVESADSAGLREYKTKHSCPFVTLILLNFAISTIATAVIVYMLKYALEGL